MIAPSAITLSQLASKVSHAINNTFRNNTFWVIADITSHLFKRESNYHYFELVEKYPKSNNLLAKFNCKAWGEGAQCLQTFEEKTGQTFTSNINVLVSVKVSYHPTYGLQLELIDIDPYYTLGALEQKKQETLLKLIQENPTFITKDGDRFKTRNNQLQLKRVIQTIAVISSKTSAGLQDFRHTLETNTYKYNFEISEYFADIQGDKNFQSIIDALIDIYKSNISFDVVVIIRGGGSQTDFLIFDNYKVVMAVAKFPIPIVSGIGHQKNETIVDLMAHTSTKTPTKAAEFIICHNKDFEDEIKLLQKSIIIRSQQLLSKENKALSNINSMVVNNSKDLLDESNLHLLRLSQAISKNNQTLLFRNRNTLNVITNKILIFPQIAVIQKRQNLSNVINTLKVTTTNLLKNQITGIEHFRSIIRVMSPDNILRKGFAIVKKDGNIISSANTIAENQELTVIFSGKAITTTVKSTKEYHGTEFNI